MAKNVRSVKSVRRPEEKAERIEEYISGRVGERVRMRWRVWSVNSNVEMSCLTLADASRDTALVISV